MEISLGGKTAGKSTNTETLSAIHAEACQRLTGVQQSLESKGVDGAFVRAAKADPVGELGVLGNIIANLAWGGAIAGMLDDSFHMSHLLGDFNEAALTSVEALTSWKDADAKERSTRKRSKLNLYPEGRRKCKIKEALRKGFNIRAIAANGNKRRGISAQAHAELASMFEIVDMISCLEGMGARHAAKDNDESAKSGKAGDRDMKPMRVAV